MQNIETFEVNDEIKQVKKMSLESFNQTFNASLVCPPNNVVAFGCEKNDFYIFSNFPCGDIVAIENNQIYGCMHDVLKYWMKYVHPNIKKEKKEKYYFLFCLWDGYRERIKFNSIENYILSYPTKNNNDFCGKTELVLKDNREIPVFHKDIFVFAVSKHYNDPYTICIPDAHFIRSRGYENENCDYKSKKYIDENNIPFNEKKNICIYRGTIGNSSVTNFFDSEKYGSLNQREYLKKLFKENKIQNFDYNDGFMEVKEQLKYRYILDVDGYTNTFDATAWKLYSGSVLLKTKSVWRQWYYDEFKEWVNYVPVNNDFSDLNEKIQWCIDNQNECKKIISNAKKMFENVFNWENALKYTVNVANKYISV